MVLPISIYSSLSFKTVWMISDESEAIVQELMGCEHVVKYSSTNPIITTTVSCTQYYRSGGISRLSSSADRGLCFVQQLTRRLANSRKPVFGT